MAMTPLNIPNPDPSAITTERIEKLRAELGLLFATRLDALEGTFNTRMEANTKAFEVFRENLNRVPTLLDREVERLNELANEKFRNIADRFNALDVRNADYRAAMKDAMQAALATQKDAVAAQNIANETSSSKSEAGFTKEIDGLKKLIDATDKALTSQLTDITARQNRAESRVQGSHDAKSDTRLSINTVVGIIAGFVGVFMFAAVVVFGIMSNTGGGGSDPGVVNVHPPSTITSP